MLAIELIAEIGEKLGRGIALLINIFNPELIVIGGTLSYTDEYINSANKKRHQQVLPKSGEYGYKIQSIQTW